MIAFRLRDSGVASRVIPKAHSVSGIGVMRAPDCMDFVIAVRLGVFVYTVMGHFSSF